MANREHNRVGAVIVFKAGTDLAKAQKFLDELIRRDIIDADNCGRAHTYNDDWGGPVWYIP